VLLSGERHFKEISPTVNKVYLGDGVYVEQDEYSGIVLTTENGIQITNTIVLEPQVIANLFAYLKAAGITERLKQ